MALAERVVGQARPGEEIEAYVARGHDVEVARLRRRGRVALLGDHRRHRRPGAARRRHRGGPARVRLGRLARRRRRRRGARGGPGQRRVRHPRPRRGLRRARRGDGRRARPVGPERGVGHAPTRRSPWPSSSSARSGTPTPGSARSPRPTTATSGSRWPWPRRPASARFSRRTAAYLSASAIAGEGARQPHRQRLQRPAGASPTSTPTGLRSDAVERATRMLGAAKPPSDRLTVVFDRRVGVHPARRSSPRRCRARRW